MSLAETPQTSNASTDLFEQAEALIKKHKTEAASTATVQPPTPEEARAESIKAAAAAQIEAMRGSFM